MMIALKTMPGSLLVAVVFDNTCGINIPFGADGNIERLNEPPVLSTTQKPRNSGPRAIYVGRTSRTRSHMGNGLGTRDSPCTYDDAYMLRNDCDHDSASSGGFPVALKVMGSIIGLSLVALLVFIAFRKLCSSVDEEDETLARSPSRIELVTTSRRLQSHVPAWTSVSPVLPRDDETGWSRSNNGENVLVTNTKTLRVVCPTPEDYGIDGAMCNRGFWEGKHVFAFMWPRDQRYLPGAHICVGIGYSCEMHHDFDRLLVGGNKSSIGFNLIDNTLYFGGKPLTSYPPDRQPHFCVPTLFYMYLDLDSNRLSFGTEDETWGAACAFQGLRVRKNDPVFPMVAFMNVTGKFMMFYKGEVNMRPPPSIQQTSSTPDTTGSPVDTTQVSTVNAGIDNFGFEHDQRSSSAVQSLQMATFSDGAIVVEPENVEIRL